MRLSERHLAREIAEHGYGNKSVFYAIRLAGNAANKRHHRLVLHLHVYLRDHWHCDISHRGENAGIHSVNIGCLEVVVPAIVGSVEGVHNLESCAEVPKDRAVEVDSSAVVGQHSRGEEGTHEVDDSLGEADDLAEDTVDDNLEQKADMMEVEAEEGLKVAHTVAYAGSRVEAGKGEALRSFDDADTVVEGGNWEVVGCGVGDVAAAGAAVDMRGDHNGLAVGRVLESDLGVTVLREGPNNLHSNVYCHRNDSYRHAYC